MCTDQSKFDSSLNSQAYDWIVYTVKSLVKRPSSNNHPDSAMVGQKGIESRSQAYIYMTGEPSSSGNMVFLVVIVGLLSSILSPLLRSGFWTDWELGFIMRFTKVMMVKLFFQMENLNTFMSTNTMNIS